MKNPLGGRISSTAHLSRLGEKSAFLKIRQLRVSSLKIKYALKMFRENKIKTEQSLRDLWDTIKHASIHIIESLQRREEKERAEIHLKKK